MWTAWTYLISTEREIENRKKDRTFTAWNFIGPEHNRVFMYAPDLLNQKVVFQRKTAIWAIMDLASGRNRWLRYVAENKVIRLLRQFFNCGSEAPLCHNVIHRNRGVVAGAGTRKQPLSVGDFLCADGPFKGKMVISNLLHTSKDRHGLQLNVETIPMWTVWLHLFNNSRRSKIGW
jgi:hypothetical protein